METAYLTEYDLSRCIGSSRYQICLDMIATETGHGSCLATLFFKGSVEALQICDTEQICPSSDGKSKLRYWSLASNVCNHCLYSI